MADSSAYTKGYRRFVYHLAEDAIMMYLERRPHLNGYLEGLASDLESLDKGTWEYDPADLLDEATAAANELANKVQHENESYFYGGNHKILIEAAYDRVGIAY